MMSLAFPSPGHQPTNPDGGEIHVSARVLLGTKLIRANAAGTTATAVRYVIFVIVFMRLFPSLFLLRNFAGEGSRKSFRHGKSSECCSRGETFRPEDSLFTPQRY